ncbi:MAG: hypothetical protein IPG48_05130 [Saprospiraceae bacterium]|nr:hypothetical protein [Saprospiraceae bacterium]
MSSNANIHEPRSSLPIEWDNYITNFINTPPITGVWVPATIDPSGNKM